MKSLAERIVIQQGDLTEMATDAIVNAANNDLILKRSSANATASAVSRSAMRPSPRAEN
jgi:O-acetyl-ADP-ribose deacetylase (regulator of RNase III)